MTPAGSPYVGIPTGTLGAVSHKVERLKGLQVRAEEALASVDDKPELLANKNRQLIEEKADSLSSCKAAWAGSGANELAALAGHDLLMLPGEHSAAHFSRIELTQFS